MKVSKFLFSLIMVTVLLFMPLTETSFAAVDVSFESGGLNYKTNGENTVAVSHPKADFTNGKTVTGEINIPSTVEYQGNTYTVTEVAKNGFMYLRSITKVTIPDTVTKIGEHAFRDCAAMKNVEMPKRLDALDLGAFRFCEALEDMTIPEGITEIKDYTFQRNKKMKLTSPVIPDSVTLIRGSAFAQCASIDRIELNNVNHLETRAFSECTGLKYLDLGKSATGIKVGWPLNTTGAKFYGYTFEFVKTVETLVLPQAGITDYNRGAEESGLIGFKDHALKQVIIRTDKALTAEELADTAGYQFAVSDSHMGISPSMVKQGEITAYAGTEKEDSELLTGTETELNLNVEGSYNGVDLSSNWNIQGSIDPRTKIEVLSNQKAALTIGEDEALTGLTITATSAYDSSKTASWQFNVSKSHMVYFHDWDNTVLDSQRVKEGDAATPPEDPKWDNYIFRGWSSSFDKILEEKIITAQYKLDKPTLTVSREDLTWTEVPGAKTYEVYRKMNGESDYIRIATLRGTFYGDTLAAGRSAVYRVQAHSEDEQVLYPGDFSNEVTISKPASTPGTPVVSTPANPGNSGNSGDGVVLGETAKPKLKAPAKLKAKAARRAARLSWRKVSGARGYVIYRATKKKGKYKRIKTIKRARTVKFTNKKLKKGKIYYYKVRAYKTVKGKRVYSKYSRIVKVRAR